MSEMEDFSEPDRVYIDLDCGTNNQTHIESCLSEPVPHVYHDNVEYTSTKHHLSGDIFSPTMFQPWQKPTEITHNAVQPRIEQQHPAAFNQHDAQYIRHCLSDEQALPTYKPSFQCNNLDSEVSYYSMVSNNSGCQPYFDQQRSSSVETTMSTSSNSTMYSYGSGSFEQDHGFNCETYTTTGNTHTSSFPNSIKKTKTTNTEPKKHKKAYTRYPKPPYSYAGMISTAIENTPEKRLTLKGVHVKLSELFQFFRGNYTGWKDSVRHNLSHNACFYKDDACVIDKYGREVKGASYWRVDRDHVYPDMFRRQENVIGQSGLYRRFIHSHLDLPPIELPGFPRRELTFEEDSYYHTESTPEKSKDKQAKRQSTVSIKSEGPVTDTTGNTENITPKLGDVGKTTGNKENGTPQMADVKYFNMKLPVINSCVIPTDSPDQCHGRDMTYYKTLDCLKTESGFDNITPVKTEYDSEHGPSPKRRRLSYSNIPTKTADVSRMYDFVISGDSPSALDAIENLRSLCITESDYCNMDTTEDSNPRTHGVSTILTYESGFTKYDSSPLHLSGKTRHKRRSSDFSIESLIHSD